MVFANIGGFVIDIFGYKGFIPNEEIDYKTFTNKTSYLNLTILVIRWDTVWPYVDKIYDIKVIGFDENRQLFKLKLHPWAY